MCHSLRTRLRVSGPPAALLDRLRAAQPTAYSALIELGDYSLVSLSPELFFRKSQGRVLLKPMKGTLAAGPSEQDDAALAEGMRQDAKTTAENVMIVDLLRNDIGRLARPVACACPSSSPWSASVGYCKLNPHLHAVFLDGV